MTKRQKLRAQPPMIDRDGRDLKSHGSLDADIIIANAPDPVFVSDLEGKILQANDAVSRLLGFRPDELIEQSLSKFISPEETREFTAAPRGGGAQGGARGARRQPRFRPDELIEQSLSKFISPEETREFTAALREVVAKGVTRDARLNPRSASGETIATTLNAAALRAPEGRGI